jgi:hypothetical protein
MIDGIITITRKTDTTGQASFMNFDGSLEIGKTYIAKGHFKTNSTKKNYLPFGPSTAYDKKFEVPANYDGNLSIEFTADYAFDKLQELSNDLDVNSYVEISDFSVYLKDGIVGSVNDLQSDVSELQSDVSELQEIIREEKIVSVSNQSPTDLEAVMIDGTITITRKTDTTGIGSFMNFGGSLKIGKTYIAKGHFKTNST